MQFTQKSFMFAIFTYSSGIFPLISFQIGTKFCLCQGGQAAWKFWQQLPSYPVSCPPAQDLSLRTPEPISFLWSPWDVLQQVLIPNALLCPPSKLPLCLNILLTKETKGPSPDCPHSWSTTLLASGVWVANQKKKKKNSQVLLKKMEMERNQRFAVNSDQLGKCWCPAPSHGAELESLQIETQVHFLASLQWPKMHPWLRITYFYHRIGKQSKNLRSWEYSGGLMFSNSSWGRTGCASHFSWK